ncbi:MAG TPA: bifunctional nuclease family protein [Lacipirellulaceae bacterium]|nr:bifunctional nuclease family protein [Lacipirellulaceae bacterium]HMP06196.1 bifunctional nuclease family protein [Lacipirellulaceae bacterium]
MIHLCQSHARSHFQDERDWYESVSRVGKGKPATKGNGIAFDVDYLLWDETLDMPWGRHYVNLIEVGGIRRLGFPIGVEASSALSFALHRSQARRPMTHQAMAQLIASLGGILQSVEIDKFSPAEQIYEAKLHIRQMKTDMDVDLRPSDAIVLSLVCDVPIIVSPIVLAALDKHYSPPC